MDHHGHRDLGHQRAGGLRPDLAAVGGARQHGQEGALARGQDPLVEQGAELVVAVDLGEQALEEAAGGGVDHRRHPAQQVQQVLAHVAVVGQVGERRQGVVDGVDHQIVLAGPAAVEGGLAGAGAGGHPLHGQPGVADRLELVQDGVEDRALQGVAPAPGGDPLRARQGGRLVRRCGDRSTSRALYSERLRSQCGRCTVARIVNAIVH